MVRYRAVSSSRFQEYFPEPGTVTTRTGPSLTVDVPSSARPLPPDIGYVVPTFGWDRQATTNTKTEVRGRQRAAGLPDRPWYSSGPDELLGVVLWPASAPGPAHRRPARGRQGVHHPVGTGPHLGGRFARAHAGARGRSRPRRAARPASPCRRRRSTVDVAGHTVGYDPDRQLWYCDIQFDNPSAYTPFVRLALARYQPHSIPGRGAVPRGPGGLRAARPRPVRGAHRRPGRPPAAPGSWWPGWPRTGRLAPTSPRRWRPASRTWRAISAGRRPPRRT